jgi:hypothetical protein
VFWLLLLGFAHYTYPSGHFYSPLQRVTPRRRRAEISAVAFARIPDPGRYRGSPDATTHSTSVCVKTATFFIAGLPRRCSVLATQFVELDQEEILQVLLMDQPICPDGEGKCYDICIGKCPCSRFSAECSKKGPFVLLRAVFLPYGASCVGCHMTVTRCCCWANLRANTLPSAQPD